MKIAEIFTSIQGEGTFSGYPTLFIRLAGCNLHCTYCDTCSAQKDGGKEMAAATIAGEASRAGVTHVCVTGGEPLLQSQELSALTHMLKDTGLEVSIETNGTYDFRRFQETSSICMDVKCPTSGEQSDLSLLQYIRDQDSVKFVIGSMDDLVYAHETMTRYPVKGTIFWSPVFGTDPHMIVSYMLEHKLPVRFQLQLHKIIGVQ